MTAYDNKLSIHDISQKYIGAKHAFMATIFLNTQYIESYAIMKQI